MGWAGRETGCHGMLTELEKCSVGWAGQEVG